MGVLFQKWHYNVRINGPYVEFDNRVVQKY